MRPLTAIVLIAVALVILPSFFSPAHSCVQFTRDQTSMTLDEVGEKIVRLRFGSDEARVDIKSAPWPHFKAWREPIDTSERPQLLEQVDRMRRWLKAEKDDELAFAVLFSVSGVELTELTPLFVDALGHRAAEIRKTAVQRFVQYPDARSRKALRKLARTEPRERIQVELALALAALQDKDDLRTWKEWAEGEQPTYRVTGLRSLSHVRDDTSLETALEMTRSLDPETARLGASLLESWSDTDEVLNLLIDLAGQDHAAREQVVGTLLAMQDERADARLLELVANDTAKRRDLLFAASWDQANPRLAESLLAMGGLDLEDLQMLESLNTPHPELPVVAEPIGRAEDSGLQPVRRDPRFDVPWFITGNPFESDVACAPETREGESFGVQPRLPVGAVLNHVSEVIELSGVERVYVNVESYGYCLVPRSTIAPLGPDDAVPTDATPRVYDMPVRLVSHERVRELEVQKTLTVREVRSALATIRLSDELDDDACRKVVGELRDLAWDRIER